MVEKYFPISPFLSLFPISLTHSHLLSPPLSISHSSLSLSLSLSFSLSLSCALVCMRTEFSSSLLLTLSSLVPISLARVEKLLSCIAVPLFFFSSFSLLFSCSFRLYNSSSSFVFLPPLIFLTRKLSLLPYLPPTSPSPPLTPLPHFLLLFLPCSLLSCSSIFSLMHE